MEGGGAPLTGKIIYELNDDNITQGVNQQLKDGEKTKFNIIQNSFVYGHSLEIIDLQNDRATIMIYSQPITLMLYLGEEKQINLDNDNYYDLYIKLEKIENNKADIYLKSIYEKIPANESGIINKFETNEPLEEKTSYAKDIFNKIKQTKLYILNEFVVIILSFLVITISVLIILKILIKKTIVLDEDNTKLTNIIGKTVYTEDGHQIGEIKDIYIENHNIYGWLIEFKKTSHIKKQIALIRHQYIKSIGNIVIIEGTLEEYSENFDK